MGRSARGRISTVMPYEFAWQLLQSVVATAHIELGACSRAACSRLSSCSRHRASRVEWSSPSTRAAAVRLSGSVFTKTSHEGRTCSAAQTKY